MVRSPSFAVSSSQISSCCRSSPVGFLPMMIYRLVLFPLLSTTAEGFIHSFETVHDDATIKTIPIVTYYGSFFKIM